MNHKIKNKIPYNSVLLQSGIIESNHLNVSSEFSGIILILVLFLLLLFNKCLMSKFYVQVHSGNYFRREEKP